MAFAILEPLDGDDIAALHDIAGGTGRRAESAITTARSRPAHLVERQDRLGAVGQPDPRTLSVDAEHNGEAPLAELEAGIETRELVAPARPFGELDPAQGTMPPALAAVEIGEAPAERTVGQRLQLGRDGGANRQATLVEPRLAVDADQLPSHLLGEEVGMDELVRPALTQLKRLGVRRLRLVGGDVAILEHARDDVGAPRHRRVRIAGR